MSDIAIEIKDLGKEYVLGKKSLDLRESIGYFFKGLVKSKAKEQESIWALRDINLEVRKGEVLGLIGPNGAGKSTLLKILSKITMPTTGRVRLEGRVSSLLEVGTGFHPELTGKENIFLNGAILGMTRPEISAKYDEIIDFSGVEKFLDTPVKHYSSGMYARLAFSVAAHLEPEILLVDEVLSVGDAEFQKKCLGKMNHAAYEGRTVIFVSHNMNAVRSLCSKVAVIDGGRIREVGEAGEMVQGYLGRGIQGNQFHEWKDRSLVFNDVQMISMEIFAKDRKEEELLLPNDDLIVELTFEVEKELSNLDFFIWLSDTNDYGLFRGVSKNLNHQYFGKYAMRFNIPANFLNVGTFRLSMLAFKDGKSIKGSLVENVLQFEISPLFDHFNSKYKVSKCPIEPNLMWELHQLKE